MTRSLVTARSAVAAIRTSCLVLGLVLASPAWAAVSVLDAPVSNTDTDGNLTLTVSAGPNRWAILGCHAEGADINGTVSLGGQAPTQTLVTRGAGGGEGGLRSKVYIWNDAAIALASGSVWNTGQSASATSLGCMGFTIKDASQTVPTNISSNYTSSSTPNPFTGGDLTVSDGSLVYALTSGGNSSSTISWTGATERDERDANSSNQSIAYDIQSGAGTFSPRATQSNQNRRHDINIEFAAAVAAPTITDVETTEVFQVGQTAVTVTGTNYEASQGGGLIEFCNSATRSGATCQTQTVTSWAATAIDITASQGSLSLGTNYVFVTNNSGGINGTGFSITLNSPMTLPTPSGTLGTATTATLGGTTLLTSGNFYAVVDTGSNLSGVTATQVKAGQKASGAAALKNCNAAVSTGSPSCGVSGLTASTAYVYAIVQNAASNDTTVLTGSFTTAMAVAGSFDVTPVVATRSTTAYTSITGSLSASGTITAVTCLHNRATPSGANVAAGLCKDAAGSGTEAAKATATASPSMAAFDFNVSMTPSDTPKHAWYSLYIYDGTSVVTLAGEFLTPRTDCGAAANAACQFTQIATVPDGGLVALYSLAYDGQTANFNASGCELVTGGTSGATAYIYADTDGGSTGTLKLWKTNGIFADNETLTGDGCGSTLTHGIAVVNGTATAYVASNDILVMPTVVLPVNVPLSITSGGVPSYPDSSGARQTAFGGYLYDDSAGAFSSETVSWDNNDPGINCSEPFSILYKTGVAMATSPNPGNITLYDASLPAKCAHLSGDVLTSSITFGSLPASAALASNVISGTISGETEAGILLVATMVSATTGISTIQDFRLIPVTSWQNTCAPGVSIASMSGCLAALTRDSVTFNSAVVCANPANGLVSATTPAYLAEIIPFSTGTITYTAYCATTIKSASCLNETATACEAIYLPILSVTLTETLVCSTNSSNLGKIFAQAPRPGTMIPPNGTVTVSVWSNDPTCH